MYISLSLYIYIYIILHIVIYICIHTCIHTHTCLLYMKPAPLQDIRYNMLRLVSHVFILSLVVTLLLMVY